MIGEFFEWESPPRGPRCESSPGQPADQSVSVEGKCSGNTDSNQNVNCASGDGTNVGNTHNKGSSVDGTTPAQCCEAPPTGGSSSSIEGIIIIYKIK